MTDPRRLLDGGGSNLERDLLEAGQAELPEASAKRRAAVALAIGAATASVWPTAAYATAKAGKAGMPLLMKLLAAGAVGAGTLGTATYLITKNDPAPVTEAAPPAAVETATRGASKPRVAPKPVETPAPAEPVATAETAEAKPAPEVRRSPAPQSQAAPASSISEEIRVLDEARRAIASGDSTAAKRALEQHRQKYPKGALAEEAVLLQIESLVKQGKRGAARSLADRFRASHPNSPHLRRIESVLAEP
jgi:TolA-binding protein